jgi:benzoylformate decarboxylase
MTTETDATTGADLFAQALANYGVTRVFGNPGTTELPVVKAITDSEIDYTLALHEDIAVGMAAGYASTRRYHADDERPDDGDDHHDHTASTRSDQPHPPVGVANLHLSAGLAHGLGNLYGAAMTGAPVVVTAGIHSADFRHEEPILSGDLARLTEQFTKWSDEVRAVSALPTMLRRAFRVALTPPTGPVFLALPLDVMQAETDATPERLGAIPDAGAGDPRQIAHATDLLVEADDPVMVVGDGVARSGRNAVAAAVDLAEAAGARVHGEVLACEVDFPTDHEQWVSYLPPDETLTASLLATDTILFVGCSTNTTLVRHDDPLVDADTTCLHVSDDAWELGKNQPGDAAVLGDPGRVMDELASRVGDRLDDEARSGRLERVAAMKQLAESQMSELAEDDADDPRPSKAELVDGMREAVPDAYIVDESVTSKYAMLTRWPLSAQQYYSNKGGGLGYGLPAAVGAAMAESERADPREVVGFVGDGSYLYYPQTLYTAARYDVDLAVVVPDNRNYRILKDNAADLMDVDADAPGISGLDFEPAVDIPTNAESHGAVGRQVERPEAVADAVREAVAEDGPAVVDVLIHD